MPDVLSLADGAVSVAAFDSGGLVLMVYHANDVLLDFAPGAGLWARGEDGRDELIVDFGPGVGV